MDYFDNKAKLYDEFKDYVIGKLRDTRHNPNLDLREFDAEQTRHSGPTHVKFILENVDSATKKLYEGVEAFRPGSVLRTEEKLTSGGSLYIAYIPYKSSSSKKGHHHYSGGVEFPSTARLYLYIFLIMATLMAAMGFTRRDDWRFLF